MVRVWRGRAASAGARNSPQSSLPSLTLTPPHTPHTRTHSQGGASTQFSAIPLNLTADNASAVMDYVVTGSWSKKAAGGERREGGGSVSGWVGGGWVAGGGWVGRGSGAGCQIWGC